MNMLFIRSSLWAGPMAGQDHFPRPDPALIAELYARIRHLGAGRPLPEGPPDPGSRLLSIGPKAIDDALPWGGLPRAGLHEILALGNGAAAGGFCAILLAGLIEAGSRESGSGESGTALWCRRLLGLYGPGLALFGLDPARLIIVQARTDTDLFWVMEEALRSGALVGVLGEIGAAPPTALRRLQLAAEAHGTMALLLRPQESAERWTPAVSRWRVSAIPGAMETEETAGRTPRAMRCRWQVELVRCKSGLAGIGAVRREGTETGMAGRWPVTWLVECDETNRLAVAAELRHRPADPGASARTSA